MTAKKPTIQFDGNCAFAVSTGKLNVKGGNHQLIIDNKTYIFSNGVAKFLFKILPNRVSKATAVWKNKE